jgi:flagellar protein FlbD
MIELTKLNDTKLVINSDLIEYVEALPDSLIKMTTGMKIMVKETIPEIIAAVIEFRKSIRREGNYHATTALAETGGEVAQNPNRTPGDPAE